MSDSIKFIDDLLTTFGKEVVIIEDNDNNEHNKNTSNTKSTTSSTSCSKHKNGTIIHSTNNNDNDTKITNTSLINDNDNDNDNKDYSDDKEDNDDDDNDELTEEEALRLAMEMSMNDEDRLLISNIKKEICQAQSHLSNWFNGSFKSVRDKNRAWCDFCKRLHHKFEMYRIEHGIIQPLSYQFFIQFIALMYGTMKQNNNNQTCKPQLHIDQHKIKDIVLLSADDDAIKYLRFKDGVSKNELKDAIYAKFSSLALDPMAPNEWKFNHVMFIRSEKAPNGLLWTKWHMQ